MSADRALQARAFLRSLTAGAPSGHQLNLRAISQGRVVERFAGIGEVGAAADWALAQAERADVFVGVATRAWRSGRKDAVEAVRLLWADLDSPGSVERLTAFQPAPSLVVSTSPAHAHAYWWLSEPI